MAKSNASPMRVIEETPRYWGDIFDYPPFNVVDDDVFQALQDLLVRMETTESLHVVVFESALPDFYLSHFDLTGKIGNIMSAIGPTGLPILMDTFVRLTKSPVVSLARIRGRVRGVSSEFVLACDMRFASRENTKLGHPELGVGLHPGGGGTERLPQLVGRGRALEIVLSDRTAANDVHLHLGESNAEGRNEWIAALDTIESLKPVAAIAGHKRPGAPDMPDNIEATRKYIRDFDRTASHTQTAVELYKQMLTLYSERINPAVLWNSSIAIKPKG